MQIINHPNNKSPAQHSCVQQKHPLLIFGVNKISLLDIVLFSKREN